MIDKPIKKIYNAIRDNPEKSRAISKNRYD